MPVNQRGWESPRAETEAAFGRNGIKVHSFSDRAYLHGIVDADEAAHTGQVAVGLFGGGGGGAVDLLSVDDERGGLIAAVLAAARLRVVVDDAHLSAVASVFTVGLRKKINKGLM